ncbi:MAG: hypothetical protein ABSA76_01635 [Bacteroidales bacterium]
MKLTLFQKIVTVFENQEHQVFTRRQIIEKLQKKYKKIKPGSINLTDFCYNRTRSGTKFHKHPRLFNYDGKNRYEYLGYGFRYLGLIYQRKKGEKEDLVVGDWLYGREVIYDDGYYLFIKDIRKRIIDSLRSIYYNSSYPKERITNRPDKNAV